MKTNRRSKVLLLLTVCLVAASHSFGAEPTASSAPPTAVDNVRERGSRGDGTVPDTAAINRSMTACANRGAGEVMFPPGRYLSGTVRLRSHVTLVLSPGARLVRTTNLTQYQQPTPPDFMP